MRRNDDILYHTIMVILVVIVLVWISQFGLNKFTSTIESMLVNAASQR